VLVKFRLLAARKTGLESHRFKRDSAADTQTHTTDVKKIVMTCLVDNTMNFQLKICYRTETQVTKSQDRARPLCAAFQLWLEKATRGSAYRRIQSHNWQHYGQHKQQHNAT
jgi:hypothetical protein